MTARAYQNKKMLCYKNFKTILAIALFAYHLFVWVTRKLKIKVHTKVSVIITKFQ